MSDDQTQRKQDLLKTEIYEKGYDLENFSFHMDGIKQNGGTDIDVWTFEELEQQVKDYQAKVEKEKVEQNQFEQGEEQQEEAQKNQEMQQQSQEIPVNEDDNYFRLLPCQRVNKNELENSAIQIIEYTKKQGGYFSSSYAIFKVSTYPQEWAVYRRYNDFQWLKDILHKQYPGICIPPIPKKSSTRNFQDLYLSKRMKYLEVKNNFQTILQRFLTTIMKQEELQNDKYLLAFLQVSDEQKFKNLQKVNKFMMTIALGKLDQIKTTNGSATIAINPQINSYIKNTQELLNNYEILYRRLRKQSKQLIMDFDQTSNTLYGLGETFGALYNTSAQYNVKFESDKVIKLSCQIILKNIHQEEIFVILNNMLVHWGNIVAIQIKHVQDYFSNFYKFYHHEIQTLKEYLKQRDQAEYEYDKFKQRLDLKKEKLFQSADFNRMEIPPQKLANYEKQSLLKNKPLTMSIMLPKETQGQAYLRDIFGYYNNQAYEEIKRIQQQNIKESAQHFSQFVQLQSDTVTEMHILWADTMTNLQSLGGKKHEMTLMEGVVKIQQE